MFMQLFFRSPRFSVVVVVCGLESLGGWLLTRIMTLAIFGASAREGQQAGGGAAVV